MVTEGDSMKAKDFLNTILTTEKLEGAAVASHDEGWYAAKKRDLSDPNNPFKGWGEKRIRVRDLDSTTHSELGIPENADSGADVFHPFFKSLSELDTDTRGKNVVPLAVLCYGLGDFLLSPEASLEDLIRQLDAIIDGTDKAAVNTLMRLNHACFQAQEIRVGARPFGENARDDFPIFSSLKGDVAELDAWTLLPAAKWLRSQI